MTSRRRSDAAPGRMPAMSRRQTLRLAALGPLAGLAAACTVPGQTPPPTLFRLTPKSTFNEDLPMVDWQLVLQTPQADASLNSTRIALQRSPMKVEYYARSSWTDRAPLMVQTLMIESFENSQRIVSVGRESVGLRADFVLRSELREFQAEYFDSVTPTAHVNITVKLVRMPTRDIIGSQAFKHRVPAAADRREDVIAAFDAALGRTLRHLVEWTITTGTAAYQQA